MFISCHRHGRDTLAALPKVNPFPFQRQSGMFFIYNIYRPLDYYSMVVSGQLAMTHA